MAGVSWISEGRSATLKLSWMCMQAGRGSCNRIVLYASKLAACAGMHRYCPQGELLREFRHARGLDDSFVSRDARGEAAIRALSPCRRAEVREAVGARYATATDLTRALDDLTTPRTRERSPPPPAVVRAVSEILLGASSESSAAAAESSLVALPGVLGSLPEDVRGEVLSAARALDGSGPRADARAAAERAVALASAPPPETVVLPSEVAEAARSAMYTRHGTEQEDAVRRASPRDIRLPANPRLFMVSARPLTTVLGSRVLVGGSNDGVASGRIVEIKTRQRGFLGTPIYELVQIHAYMHISETREALLIESYQGEQREHVVRFDDVLWADVRRRVDAFLAELLQGTGGDA